MSLLQFNGLCIALYNVFKETHQSF